MRLDVDPASGGGFLTGDAVNTAARLQAAAPPGGVAVGALTHELTARVIDYEELPPVAAKGKAEPVPAWLRDGDARSSRDRRAHRRPDAARRPRGRSCPTSPPSSTRRSASRPPSSPSSSASPASARAVWSASSSPTSTPDRR